MPVEHWGIGGESRGNDESEVNANGDTVTITQNGGGASGILTSSAWRVNTGTEYEILIGDETYIKYFYRIRHSTSCTYANKPIFLFHVTSILFHDLIGNDITGFLSHTE